MKKILYTCLSLLFMTAIACSSDDSKNAASPYSQYGSVFTGMPDKADAVIYQVNVRSFSPEGNLNGVRQRLQDIKDLGANVVYLMPIYPVGEVNAVGELGSPYAVKNYKEVNPAFGNLEDLRNLVNEAHSIGLAVILDWVANHTAWDNPWISEHKEYYLQDANGNILIPPGTNWADVAQLNFENPDTKAAMIDAMSYWVYSANVDGFRCDAADYVPNHFWAEAVPKLRGIKNQKLLMLAEGEKDAHFYSGFDYTFGFGFFYALKDTYAQSSPATRLQEANATEYGTNYNEQNRIVRYTTNHDVNWTDGTPYELFRGRNGSMAAFVVAAFMKSVPMIYNGQEIGYNQRIDFFSDNPIDWNSADASLLAEYKSVLAVRNASDAVKRGSFAGYSSTSVCAFTMTYNGKSVLVLSNLTNAPANYIVPATLAGNGWNDALSGAQNALGQEIILPANGYRIFAN